MRDRTEEVTDIHLKTIPTVLLILPHPLLNLLLAVYRSSFRNRTVNVLIHAMLYDRLQYIDDHMMQYLLIEARNDNLTLLLPDAVEDFLRWLIPMFIPHSIRLIIRYICVDVIQYHSYTPPVSFTFGGSVYSKFNIIR